MTTREEILDWLAEGQAPEVTHMLVVCDTFDGTYYPVYARSVDEVREQLKELTSEAKMSRVVEIYNYELSLEAQLDETFAWNIVANDVSAKKEEAHRRRDGLIGAVLQSCFGSMTMDAATASAALTGALRRCSAAVRLEDYTRALRAAARCWRELRDHMGPLIDDELSHDRSARVEEPVQQAPVITKWCIHADPQRGVYPPITKTAMFAIEGAPTRVDHLSTETRLCAMCSGVLIQVLMRLEKGTS